MQKAKNMQFLLLLLFVCNVMLFVSSFVYLMKKLIRPELGVGVCGLCEDTVEDSVHHLTGHQFHNILERLAEGRGLGRCGHCKLGVEEGEREGGREGERERKKEKEPIIKGSIVHSESCTNILG